MDQIVTKEFLLVVSSPFFLEPPSRLTASLPMKIDLLEDDSFPFGSKGLFS